MFKFFLSVLMVSACFSSAHAEVVARDAGFELTRAELEQLVKYWSPSMRQQAVEDPSLMLEFMNLELAAKRMAAMADDITEADDPSLYWTKEVSLRNAKRRVVVSNFMDNLDIPDMQPLAKERYDTQKDKYAKVPESRSSSHILIACAPGVCNREETRPTAERVLQELRNGLSFEEAVEQYSQDPGTKAKGGKFAKWIRPGEPHVDKQYVAGVFSINGVGNYSEIIESRFGFHIIRLDDLKPVSYKSFEEVKQPMVAELEKEYRKLAAQEWDRRFRLSDEALIDGEAVREILAPYVEQ